MPSLVKISLILALFLIAYLGICTLARKMMSFRQFEYIILL